MKTPEELDQLHIEEQALLEKLKAQHDKLQEGLTEDEICIIDGIVLKTHPESKYGFEFFTHRSPDMRKEMECFIQYAKSKKCFMDIGAAHGIFSLVFAEINKEGKVYAFEPADKAHEILNYNTEKNVRIRTFKRAISDEMGVINMKKEWDHYVLCSEEEKEFTIKCLDGDGFCENYINPDAIKIDVEGAELSVLKGLRKTIEKNHPVIFLELHTERVVKYGDSIDEILNMLIGWNYDAIDSRTNLPISYGEISEIKEGDIRLILI